MFYSKLCAFFKNARRLFSYICENLSNYINTIEVREYFWNFLTFLKKSLIIVPNSWLKETPKASTLPLCLSKRWKGRAFLWFFHLFVKELKSIRTLQCRNMRRAKRQWRVKRMRKGHGEIKKCGERNSQAHSLRFMGQK